MFEMDLGELFANPSGNGDTAVYTEVSPVHPGESEIVKLLLKQLVKLKARGAYRPSFTLSIIYCVRDTESTWLRLYGDVSWSVNDVNDAWRAALTKQEELTEQTVPVTEQQLATAAA